MIETWIAEHITRKLNATLATEEGESLLLLRQLLQCVFEAVLPSIGKCATTENMNLPDQQFRIAPKFENLHAI